MDFSYLDDPIYDLVSSIKGKSEFMYLRCEKLTVGEIEEYRQSIMEDFDKLKIAYLNK